MPLSVLIKTKYGNQGQDAQLCWDIGPLAAAVGRRVAVGLEGKKQERGPAGGEEGKLERNSEISRGH